MNMRREVSKVEDDDGLLLQNVLNCSVRHFVTNWFNALKRKRAEWGWGWGGPFSVWLQVGRGYESKLSMCAHSVPSWSRAFLLVLMSSVRRGAAQRL